MKKLMLAMVTLLAASNAFAGSGFGVIDRYFVDDEGFAWFGLTTTLGGTCAYYIEQFRFDTKTTTTPGGVTNSGGKNMLATLMAAKIAGIPVTVWYTDSTTPGQNQQTGCTPATMAVPTSIGIR